MLPRIKVEWVIPLVPGHLPGRASWVILQSHHDNGFGGDWHNSESKTGARWKPEALFLRPLSLGLRSTKVFISQK